LDRKINVRDGVEELRKAFVSLQDSLVEHMLVEEFEVYPELMRKNLLELAISSIMQQHFNVVSCLGKMELSLRLLRSCLPCGW
jgi:iron-sulfur cluster repair protein YtfE (RIC family)